MLVAQTEYEQTAGRLTEDAPLIPIVDDVTPRAIESGSSISGGSFHQGQFGGDGFRDIGSAGLAGDGEAG